MKRVFSFTISGNLTIEVEDGEDAQQIADDALECMRPGTEEKKITDYSTFDINLTPEFDEYDDDNDEEEDNTELAIQVSKENQTLLELAIHTNFGLTVDYPIPETETDTVLVYFIDEEKDKEFRQGLLGFLEERERQKLLTIRQDRALRYNVE